VDTIARLSRLIEKIAYHSTLSIIVDTIPGCQDW
jgi:hypothetical protein